MSTIRELITGSLRLINVVQANEVPTADDMNISFEAFNQMLENWSTEKLSIFSMNPYIFSFVPAKKTYTLGPGGDWDIERPMELMNAYVHYEVPSGIGPAPSKIDIPMQKLTDEQYAAITVKNIGAVFPSKYYDNGNYPLRTVTVWPIPLTVQEVQLWLWQPLADATSIDDQVNFPKGYARSLRFALAVELASEFGKTVAPQVKAIAARSKAQIKRLNSIPQIMTGDQAIASNRTSYFNYITGDTIPTNM
jgi:hypothetical protein